MKHESDPLVKTPFSMDRLIREPWIPIAALATVGVCVLGVRQFLVGDQRKSQTMMRLRVFFQGVTIFGIAMSAYRANSK